ncbi:MAG: hypothetical protein ACLQG3_14595 [Terracidiphilus sp.]
MASYQPIRFIGITRAKFQAIRARVNAEATTMVNNGDTGSATGSVPLLGQFSVSWAYDEPTQTLVVTPTKKPALVSEGYMASRMRAIVESVNA